MIISITLTKREKDIIYFWELNGPYLFEAESPSLKNALRQVWLKLAEWFWKVEIVKVYRCQKTYDRQSEKLTWAFSFSELKI